MAGKGPVAVGIVVYEYQLAYISHVSILFFLFNVIILLYKRSQLKIYLYLSIGIFLLFLNNLIVILAENFIANVNPELYCYAYLLVLLSDASFYITSRKTLPKSLPHVLDVVFSALFAIAAIDVLQGHVYTVISEGMVIPVHYGSYLGEIARGGMVALYLLPLLYGLYRKTKVTLLKTRRNLIWALTIIGFSLFTVVIIGIAATALPLSLYYHTVNFLLLAMALITIIDPYIAIFIGQNIGGFFFLDISTNHMFKFNTLHGEQDWEKIKTILSAYLNEAYDLETKTKEISIDGEKIFLFYRCNRIFGVLGDQINVDARKIIGEALNELCFYLDANPELTRQEKLDIIEKNLNKKIIYKLL